MGRDEHCNYGKSIDLCGGRCVAHRFGLIRLVICTSSSRLVELLLTQPRYCSRWACSRTRVRPREATLFFQILIWYHHNLIGTVGRGRQNHHSAMHRAVIMTVSLGQNRCARRNFAHHYRCNPFSCTQSQTSSLVGKLAGDRAMRGIWSVNH